MSDVNNGWISVDDRLPANEQHVIGCVIDRQSGVRIVSEIGLYDATWVELAWYGAVKCDGEVTHWQPLPEPPK